MRISSRYSHICLKKQGKEMTWLSQCMCTVGQYLILCAAGVWSHTRCTEPVRSLLQGVRGGQRLHLGSLPLETEANCRHLSFFSPFGLSGIKAATLSNGVSVSSGWLSCPVGSCELLALLECTIGLGRKAWNAAGWEQTWPVCVCWSECKNIRHACDKGCAWLTLTQSLQSLFK